MSETEIQERPADAAYELGHLVGRHEALGMIAQRCSAADAATIRQIREKELWRGAAESWTEFCETRLRMSRTQANRLIKLLEDFGETYFAISQATRISPETYRAIAPAISDNALHIDGEAIALTEANASRIAAAVDTLRRTIPAQATPHGEDPLQTIHRRCSDLMGELADLSRAVEEGTEDRATLRSILALMRSKLLRLEAEMSN